MLHGSLCPSPLLADSLLCPDTLTSDRAVLGAKSVSDPFFPGSLFSLMTFVLVSCPQPKGLLGGRVN